MKHINKKCRWRWLMLALLASFCPNGAEAQNATPSWPKVTGETKPWTRWWWFGSAVDEKNLTRSLEAFQKAGLGGVEITPIYGVRGEEEKFIPYLSPKWMDMLEYTLREAKRIGVGVDLANASGWPFGGPWIDEKNASKNFVTKVYHLKGGESLQVDVDYVQQPLVRMQIDKKFGVNDLKYPLSANGSLQENAFDQVRYRKELPLVTLVACKVSTKDGLKPGKVINLTSQVKDKRLQWKAPAGDWVLVALFQGDHGKMVERSGPGGEGWVIDHFSKEALDTYLAKFDTAFQDRDLSGLRYFFNDSYEVDDAVGEADWTPKMYEAFKQVNGYDLRQYLPALIGKDTLRASRVLYDYRMTINRLLMEQFTKPWQKWAAAKGKGIRNQSHGSPANVLDLYAASDVPEIEGGDIVNLKSASSASHVSGKRLASSETCTWMKEHFEGTLGESKNAVDKMLLAGVNHVFYHGTEYSPSEAAWPGWLFYAAEHFTPANTTWEDFGALNQYVTRAQSFLQAGKPANDVLLYFALADKWSKRTKNMLSPIFSDKFFTGLTARGCADFFQKEGFSWDAVTDAQLKGVTYQEGALITGGAKYKTVLVPRSQLMPAATFEQLAVLAQAGATILFQGQLPEDVPGLAQLKQGRKSMAQIKDKLAFVDDGKVKTATYGKGKFVISDDLDALMQMANVQPEQMVALGLQYIRRAKDDAGYYYFVKNMCMDAFSGNVPLNASARTLALFNPMTGVAGYAKAQTQNGKSEVFLQLKPEESIVIETFADDKQGVTYPVYEIAGDAIELTGDWKVDFVKGGPVLPKAQNLKAPLTSWTTLADGEAFSGTAEYEMQLPLLSTQSPAWRLDLKKVYESAAVFVNGEYLGTLLSAPYTLDIPRKMLRGDGTDVLKVRVTNLMANRIISMEKQDVKWKKFYNINFKAKYPKDRDSNGLFTAKKWKPKASGICGTPTLTPLINRR